MAWPGERCPDVVGLLGSTSIGVLKLLLLTLSCGKTSGSGRPGVIEDLMGVRREKLHSVV